MACDKIADWYEAAVERQGEALAAQNTALENLKIASATFVAAEVWAASCFLLVYTPPPFSIVAFGICEVPALAAMAAAAYAMDLYLDDFNAATEAYVAAEKAAAILEELLCKCEAQEARHMPTDQTLEEAQTAYAEAEAIEIPDVDDSALSDAESAVDEAESAVEEAQDYVDEHENDTETEEEAWPNA